MSEKVGRVMWLALAVCLVAGVASADIKTGLVGHWPLDGDGLDVSGNGLHGTVSGDVTPIEDRSGMANRAMLFSGASDAHIDVGDPPELQITGAMTLAAWVILDGENVNNGRIVSKMAGGGSRSWSLNIEANTNGVAHPGTFQVADGGNTIVSLSDTDSLPTDEWVHLAGVYKPGEAMEVYVNGQLKVSNTAGVPATQFSDNGYSALIGGRNAASDCGWLGAIDEVRIYSRALEAGDIGEAFRGDATRASAPNPASGAVDVPLDAVLSWVAGEFGNTHDVYLGMVSEDVQNADRANPMGVLVSENQSGTTYAPLDGLDLGRTYYWRIDEVNGAPDNTVFKGDLWSFTVEPVACPMTNVAVTSNGVSEAGAGAENTVNGSGLNDAGEHSVDASDMWLAASGDDPLYVQFEFDRIYKLHEMVVWNYNAQFEAVLGFGIKDVTVDYSTDGIEWMTLGDVALAQGTGTSTYTANTTIDFDGAAAQYVRLTVNSGQGVRDQYGLSEVRFLYIPATAREPQPADGATDVSVETLLAWRAGRDSISHDVYFGLDAEALVLADSIDTASYTPGALDLDTTYFWKVDEIQDAESWAGAIWTFVTQPYLVIDDFESYNDEDNRLYETWLDGWVNETGSTVGYLEAPFAEMTIVKSGSQAMPLFYDNTAASMSETELSLAQNWTANSVKSFSLVFHGAAENTGQLYVKINGIKMLYDGGAGDIATAVWQPWNIDLSAVGGNVSHVTSLIIGVEGAGATGVVYIDDVRLYPKAAEIIVPAEPDTANLVARYAFDGDASDSSGNGPDGMIVGDILFENDPIRGQVVSLPGGDDQYISIEGVGISGNAPRTIACWAKADNTSIPDWTLIFGFTGTADGSGGNGSHFNIGSLGGPGGVGAHVWGWEETIFSDEAALEWHHYAMSYDGTTIRYYGDGIPMDTDVAKSNVRDLSISSDRVHVGSRITHTNSFPGKVDDAVIYSVTLTDGEIAYLAGWTELIHKPF